MLSRLFVLGGPYYLQSDTSHLCPPTSYPQTQLHDRITGELFKKHQCFLKMPLPLSPSDSTDL